MNYKTEQDFIWQSLDEAFPAVPVVYKTDLNEELATLERGRIENALEAVDGNQTKAADMLSIGRTCLIAKMKKYELT
jgi:transcriptional regulator with PAS, ATPase and Fis domain|tara:strand:- start:245 stop:475 length:231 start_codon:yes stop_codon:yes gene_type:complete